MRGLGILISAGYSLDELLDLTWSQIGICIQSVLLWRQETFITVVNAIKASLGVKTPRTDKMVKLKGPSKDSCLLDQISRAGIDIENASR